MIRPKWPKKWLDEKPLKSCQFYYQYFYHRFTSHSVHLKMTLNFLSCQFHQSNQLLGRVVFYLSFPMSAISHHPILHTIPYHIIPYHTIPSYIIYHTIPYHTILYYISYHITSHHTIPYTIYHTILYHTIPYHTIPYHITP